MTTFDERERAFEQRFVRDEEARFQTRNRRNRLLAKWACEQLNLTDKVADGFVTSFTECAVVAADAVLIERLRSDLAAVGIAATPTALRREMERCAALAEAESRSAAVDEGSPA